MGGEGVKIKQLARELKVTSRQLIDRCRSEGLRVQNSITKLRPDQEALVRSWFADQATTPSTSTTGP